MISAPITVCALVSTVGYACLWYLFPALLPHFEENLGWSRSTLAGSFTCSMLVAAAVGMPVGRLIDSGYARSVMVIGALLGALGLFCLSFVTAPWQFAACWVIIGVSQGAILYEPCFSLLTRRYGKRATAAITAVTLVAGFAGTICFPTAHWLAEAGGWQVPVWVAACVMLLTALCIALFLGPDSVDSNDEEAENEENKIGALSLLKRPLFWAIAIVFSLIAFNHGGLIAHIIPLLQSRGLSVEMAVLASSFMGPMQVLGRVVLLSFGRDLEPGVNALVAFCSMIIGGICLYCAQWFPLLAAGFIFFQGAGYGVKSIVRPGVIASWFGRRGFGLIAGTVAVPVTLGYALAPALAAVLDHWGGADAVVLILTGAASLAVFILISVQVTRHLAFNRESEPIC